MQDNLFTHKILTYDDVVQFPMGRSNEPLVDVRKYDKRIVSEYLKEDMLEITGEVIYVRDALARKLAEVNAALEKAGKRIKVVYGYRHPEVQERYFVKRRAELKVQNPEMSDEDLDRLTHNFVAVPDVAGHPTGGAVDLTVIDINNEVLDMGCEIADYSDPVIIHTFDNRLTESQRKNRMLLHDLMIKVGFAPFYGEWWHFSYGDREWAAFYNKKALYSAINIEF